MRTLVALVFASLLASLSFAAPSPVGTWKTIDDETGQPKSLVEIYLDGDELKAKIIRLLNSDTPIDEQICDLCKGAKKNAPYAGLEIMWGLTEDGDEWNGGKILDPANGKEYKVFLKVSDDNSSAEVRGFIGFALIGRTQTWHRESE
jgi:uncharacterized protein (DUF2147 family)